MQMDGPGDCFETPPQGFTVPAHVASIHSRSLPEGLGERPSKGPARKRDTMITIHRASTCPSPAPERPIAIRRGCHQQLLGREANTKALHGPTGRTSFVKELEAPPTLWPFRGIEEIYVNGLGSLPASPVWENRGPDRPWVLPLLGRGAAPGACAALRRSLPHSSPAPAPNGGVVARATRHSSCLNTIPLR